MIQKKPERILGIDPGTIRCGYGMIERAGSSLRGLDAGVIKMDEGMALEGRLLVLYTGLVELIEKHAPTAAAVEDIFFAKHPQAALKLGHARGVALLALYKAGLSVAAYPPSVVKRAIAGGGGAEKTQVARMVSAVLGLRELPPLDATDALAVALTHANRVRAPAALARGARGRGGR